MDEHDCKPTLEMIALEVAHLKILMDVHMKYQRQEVEKAAADLKDKLLEMNEFREENRKLTGKFATTDTLNERVNLLTLKIETLGTHIEEGIGKRLTAIEMYRANIDGRLWIWGALITALTLFIQFYPLIRGKV